MLSWESKVNPQMITRRERTILSLIAEGYENKEIACELSMSEETVRENQMNLMRKLNVPNASSTIDYALKKGLISIYEVLESRFSKIKSEADWAQSWIRKDLNVSCQY
jgi:DNA-binding CsgD family transcriptional regulator